VSGDSIVSEGVGACWVLEATGGTIEEMLYLSLSNSCFLYPNLSYLVFPYLTISYNLPTLYHVLPYFTISLIVHFVSILYCISTKQWDFNDYFLNNHLIYCYFRKMSFRNGVILLERLMCCRHRRGR